METITWIICFAFAFIAWVQERNITNPAFILSVLFGFMMSLTSLHLYGLYEVSEETLGVIIAGIVSFNIAFWLRRKIKLVFHKSDRKALFEQEKALNNEVDYSNLENIFFVLSLIALVYSGWKAAASIRMLLSGQSLSAIRTSSVFSFSGSGVYINLFDYLLNVYIISVFRLASYTFGISYFFFTKFRCKKVLIVGIINVLLSMITNGGRAILLEFGMSFLGSYMIFRQYRGKSLIPRKFRRKILIGLAAAFAMLIIISNLRKDNFNFFKEIYIYFAYPIPFMDYHIKNYSMGYTYGYTFFYGLIKLPEFILHQIFGFQYSSLHSIAESLGQLLQATQRVGTNAFQNAFGTVFFFFYVDGGLPAVIICSFIYGLYASSVYSSVKENFTIRNAAIYGICISAVMMSFVRYQYYYPSCVNSTLLLQLLMKKNGSAKVRIVLHKQ